MKGDILLVEEHHYNVAEKIVETIQRNIIDREHPYIIAIGGESGSGKSETAEAIRFVCTENNIPAAIIQQDDYFIFPPKTNDKKRREDFSWVGTQEVKVGLLDQQLAQISKGQTKITKPLVYYNEDRIDEEVLDVKNSKTIVVEGTYTMLLNNVDVKVFIDRTWKQTLQSREKRGRDKMDDFTEKVLEKEHRIISKHKQKAHMIITKDYRVVYTTTGS